MSKGSQDGEIDLLDLFRRFGKTISTLSRATGKGLLVILVFLIRNFMLLLASILIGAGVAYIIKFTAKPVYVSEITLRSNAIPNSEMISYVNRLNLLLKEKNYPAIAGALSIPEEKAITLLDLKAFWIIDRNNDNMSDYVDYKNKHNIYDTINVRMQDRFLIRTSITVPQNLEILRDGLIYYINSDNNFKLRNEFRLKKTDELLARLNYDIDQLDSLQKIKYYEETKNMIPREGVGSVVFLQEQKTQLVYEDIYNLYTLKQKLDEEKDVYPGIISIISNFYQPVKRYNGGIYYGKVIIPVFFCIMLIYLIMYRNRKKLREIYRKY